MGHIDECGLLLLSPALPVVLICLGKGVLQGYTCLQCSPYCRGCSLLNVWAPSGTILQSYLTAPFRTHTITNRGAKCFFLTTSQHTHHSQRLKVLNGPRWESLCFSYFPPMEVSFQGANGLSYHWASVRVTWIFLMCFTVFESQRTRIDRLFIPSHKTLGHLGKLPILNPTILHVHGSIFSFTDKQTKNKIK